MIRERAAKLPGSRYGRVFELVVPSESAAAARHPILPVSFVGDQRSELTNGPIGGPFRGIFPAANLQRMPHPRSRNRRGCRWLAFLGKIVPVSIKGWHIIKCRDYRDSLSHNQQSICISSRSDGRLSCVARSEFSRVDGSSVATRRTKCGSPFLPCLKRHGYHQRSRRDRKTAPSRTVTIIILLRQP